MKKMTVMIGSFQWQPVVPSGYTVYIQIFTVCLRKRQIVSWLLDVLGICRMVFTLLWLNISTSPVTDRVRVTQWLWVQTKNMPPDLKPEQTQDCLFVEG